MNIITFAFSFVVLNFADLFTTVLAIKKYGVDVEMNPFFHASPPEIWFLVKMVFAPPVLVWSIWKIKKLDENVGLVLSKAICAVFALVIINNVYWVIV